MTASATTNVPPVHTGECRAARVAGAHVHARTYCLHDVAGRPVGTIAAPATRPRLGRSAPTVYLRRD